MTYSIGGVAGGVAISGLRAREIGDFWKYVVAHIEDAAAPADLKPRLRATLPLWNNLQANAEIHDLTLQTPMAEATMKTLGETIALSGFTADGAAEIGIKIDDLTFNSQLLPSWAGVALAGLVQLRPARRRQGPRSRSPSSRSTIRLSAARATCRPRRRTRSARSCSPDSPKLTLAPGRLTTPMLDLAFEGEASANTGAPSGHFTFSADGLDKTIALLAGDRQDATRKCRRRCSASRSSRAWRRPAPTDGWCGRST